MMSKTLRALVIDDQPHWLKMLTRLLSGTDYSVSTAQSYDAALREIDRDSHPPDLIVTDIRLRDNDDHNVDGLRLLNTLRKSGKLRSCIIVTGYPSPGTRSLADLLGAAYLEKGDFSRNDFWRELRNNTKNSINSGQHS